jgi:hypothetical protein
MADYEITSPLAVVGIVADPGRIKYSNGTNYSTVKASTTLVSNTDFVLPKTSGSVGQVLRLDGSTETEWVAPTSLRTTTTTIPSYVNFIDSTGTATGTISGSYVPFARFIYNGTVTDVVIVKITGIVNNAIGGTGQVRIYDTTNSLVIAESAIFSSTSAIIIDFGVISNLPIGQAIFELQLKSVNLLGTAFIHALHIYG